MEVLVLNGLSGDELATLELDQKVHNSVCNTARC